MKRRNFLTTAGITGIAVSSGLAATSSLLGLDAAWKLHPELSSDMVKQLDEFANELKLGLKEHEGDTRSISSIVSPKKILFANDSYGKYQVAYENQNGNFVEIMKDKKGTRTSIFTDKQQILKRKK